MVNMHVDKALCGSKEVDIKAILDRMFKLLLV
jgi:hypothetical protein